MSSAILRVILGPESCQRVVFPAGLPLAVPELQTEIKTKCQIMDLFRLQFMDTLFDNTFMNLTSMDEIEDKPTVKVIYKACRPQDDGTDQSAVSFSRSSTSPPCNATFNSGASTLILTSPLTQSTSSRSSWPDTFTVSL